MRFVHGIKTFALTSQEDNSPVTKANMYENAAAERASGPSLPATRTAIVCIEFCRM